MLVAFGMQYFKVHVLGSIILALIYRNEIIWYVALHISNGKPLSP